MENLNAEQVKKALECCTLGDCTPCPYHQIYVGCRDRMAEDALALINSYEQRIKDLENEVREAKLWADTYKEHHDIMDCECSRLEKVNEELTEENERLKNRITCQVVLSDEKLEEIKADCLERIELDVKAIQADTRREMQELIRLSLPQLLMDSSYLNVLDEEQWIPAADQLFNGILEITEEVLEDAE